MVFAEAAILKYSVLLIVLPLTRHSKFVLYTFSISSSNYIGAWLCSYRVYDV